MKLAIDVFGGDNAPQAVLEGCAAALGRYADIELLLFGDEPTMRAALAQYPQLQGDRVTLHHAPQVIGCDEPPTQAVRGKKESSLVRALTAVREGEAACVVSAGSTGALLAGATFIVRRIQGVKRPALGMPLPSLTGQTMLMDCGANVDCKPSYLVQFAVMSSAYLTQVLGVQNPRIGLLNNGTEAEKGNALTKAAYALLKDAPVNFAGNCEARDILSGAFDAVICDGFAGNVVIKNLEGLAEAIFTMLKRELTADVRSKLGAALAGPAFRRLKRVMDYTEYGGAPLLGAEGGVIKAHGSSNAKAFAAAIGQARNYALGHVSDAIREGIALLPEIED
ncbi:MAG: phosphate acyltransferase PlsX [Christensenellaceae bacterium]|jgi:glycerol-3-phosphate acyltransferase PlsX|nr:phosphate acyltransferase PlsX [Christensenellaceae bacterium]